MTYRLQGITGEILRIGKCSSTTGMVAAALQPNLTGKPGNSFPPLIDY